MLYELFEFGKTIALGVLLNEYLKNNFPSKYREIGIEIIFKILYTLSYCQIMYNKSIQYIKTTNPEFVKFIEDLLKNKPKKQNIEFIKDNKIVCESSKDYYLTTKEVAIIPEFDFILYTSGESNHIKILRENSDPSFLCNEETYQYEECKERFMLVELLICDIVYKIDLATEKYNFYVKDNVFDIKFFLYYLYHIHPDKVLFNIVDLEMDKTAISLRVIDHNVDIKTYDLSPLSTFEKGGAKLVFPPLRKVEPNLYFHL